jgi:hypothetical protein
MLREAKRLKAVARSRLPVVAPVDDSESDDDELLLPPPAPPAPPQPPPAAPTKKRTSTKKRARSPPPAAAKEQQGGGRVDLGAGEGIGEFVRRNSYGTWRTVPGFDPEHVIVSSEGWVRVRAAGGKGLAQSYAGSQTKQGYCSTWVNGFVYQVHRLILRAFHGPRPSPGHTGDHIAKYDGDWMRERGDNRACNLKWETLEGQRVNQSKHKAQRDGQPIRVRRTDWSATREWETYPSSRAADKACGVKLTGLAGVANPNRHEKSCKDKDGFKWIAEWAAPNEPQDDLPPDPDYVDAKGVSKPQPKEEWRDAIYSNGKRLMLWRVSNRGRAQRKHLRGSGWGHRFAPKPTYGHTYARIAKQLFHGAVYFSFGGALVGDQTVDHADGDETSNLLSNLRPLDKSGQVRNQTRKAIEERNNSKKHCVGCRHRDWPVTMPDLQFESHHDAARVLGVNRSHISKNVNKTRYPEGHTRAGKLMRPAPKGFVFYNVDDWDPE